MDFDKQLDGDRQPEKAGGCGRGWDEKMRG
jgi:hypothetical protein